LTVCCGADVAALPEAELVPEAGAAAFAAWAGEIMMLAPNTATHPAVASAESIVRSIFVIRIRLLPGSRIDVIAPTHVERVG
jgi:hypothetical protein